MNDNKGFLIHFTIESVVAQMLSIIDRFPGHRAGDGGSSGCTYARFNDTYTVLRPVCIVGQMFADVGLLRVLLQEPTATDHYFLGDNSCGFNVGGGDGSADLRVRLIDRGVSFDDAAWSFCQVAQNRQDKGGTWDEAVEEALVHVVTRGDLDLPVVSFIERARMLVDATD